MLEPMGAQSFASVFRAASFERISSPMWRPLSRSSSIYCGISRFDAGDGSAVGFGCSVISFGTRSHNELSASIDLILRERSRVKEVPCADRVILKFPAAVGLAMTVPRFWGGPVPNGLPRNDETVKWFNLRVVASGSRHDRWYR
jgi:hypothetical protein